MKAKILVQSGNIDTYVNVVAAICNQYKDINEIIFCFLKENVINDFVRNIREKLVSLSSTSKQYALTAKVAITAQICDINELFLTKDCDIVDVTAVSKDLAINVAASAIRNKKVKVCLLVITKSVAHGELWLLEENNYRYQNLLSQGALNTLYREYLQKKYIIFIFAVIIGILVGMSITKFLIPNFFIPSDYVNIFSLLIGAAGLYLAAVSLKYNL